MEAVTFVWPEWSTESVESETANSVVYRARRVEFNETLYAAIKITKIPVEPGKNRAEVRQRIEEWSAQMASLRSVTGLLVPEDVKVVDTADGFAVHMRMEYCSRLAVYAASHALSASELIEMGIDICTALDAMEKAGVVHGDVRPEHIFVSKRGSYRLGGFSVSRALSPAAPVGLPEPQAAYYMAPEVYRGATPSAQSDLYSLGMIIYRTLNNGRMPFLPSYPNPISPQDRLDALSRRMAGEKLPPPQTGETALVAPILHACVADPAARYASPAAFRQDLRSYMKNNNAGFTPGAIGTAASNGAAVAASTGAAAAAVGGTATAVKAPRTPAAQPAASAKAAAVKAPPAQDPPRRRISPKMTGVLIVVPLVIILVAGIATLSALGILPSLRGEQTTTAATTIASEAPTTPATTTTMITTPAATTTEATTTATTKATTRATTTTTTEATTTATTEAIEYYTDELITVQTKLNPGEVNRTTNVRIACENINGKELQPGEEFSYNDTVGPRTTERGFKDAKIYLANEIADGIGGGICQVSSTIYMAAIRADLEITERRNHRYTVSYTPEGEDATVSWGNQDFKFVNNTEYPIKLLVTLDGSYVNVTIMGTKTVNKTVEIQTTRLDYTPYETKTIVDETMAPGTSRDGNTSGHSGKKTVSYRLVYIDGELVSKTLENYSTYTKLDVVTYVGPQITTSVTGDPDQTGTGTATAPSWLGGGSTTATPDQTTSTNPTTPDTTSSPDTSSSGSNNEPPSWLGGGN
ncbi:MAG: VanW family protein [Clostridiaceae bacterium]|nr:VanW family protein [Clostridiaceae bacterium]